MTQFNWFNQIKRLQTHLKKLYLKKKHLYPEHLFIIAIETNNRFLIALFTLAAWKLPICLFPISARYPDEYKNQQLKLCGVRLLFTERSNLTDFPYDVFDMQQLYDDLLINTDKLSVLLNLQSTHSTHSTHSTTADQMFGSDKECLQKNNAIKLIVTTSGTTKKPKAVYLSRNSILHHCFSSREFINLDKTSIWLNCMPLNHVAGLMILYRVMLVQGRVLLHIRFDVNKILIDMNKYKVSHISLVPVMMQKMVDKIHQQKNNRIINPETLRYIVVGGSELSNALYIQARNLNLPVIYGYGSSESCSHITLTSIQSKQTPSLFRGKLSSGKILSGVEIKIKPIVSESPIGLIQYRSEMLMSGYANPNYQMGEGLFNGWFHSQDKGYINIKGELFVLGRADQNIITGANKVHPKLVEQMMSECPGVNKVTIYAQQDKDWGQVIAMDFRGMWDTDRVKQWIEENLASQFKPRIVNKIIKNNSGDF